MTHRAKDSLHLASLLAAMVLILSGCAADPSADGPDENSSEASSPLAPGDEGIPGEDPDPTSVDKARNCVYVQWCDEPNSPRGTICRVYSGCPVNEATVDGYWQECKRDVAAVCGQPILPFWFLPRG
jgi:hypothetical protein